MRVTVSTGVMALALAIAFSAFAGEGDTIKWTGSSGGYWDNPNNWDLKRVPEDGDDVKIEGAFAYSYHYVYLTNATPHLKSLTVGTNRKLRVSGWNSKIWADTITVDSYSNYLYNLPDIYCGSFDPATTSNRVWIVADMLTVGVNGSVYASGCASKKGPGWTGVGTISGGGSYGGLSSDGNCKTYGDIMRPEDPGSGSSYVSGGGVVRIEATSVIVKGVIHANGSGAASNQPNGAGGSVYITCETITGTGTVAANGGAHVDQKTYGAAGGGGRVSINYDVEAQRAAGCEVAFSARGGAEWNSVQTERRATLGGCGSLYLTDDQFLKRPGVKLAGKIYYGNEPTRFNGLAGDDVELVNTLFEFDEGAEVNVTGNLTMSGSVSELNGIWMKGEKAKVSVGGNLTLTGASVRLSNGGNLTVGGDLVQADGSSKVACGGLYVRAAATNGVDEAFGATVKVSGDWKIGANGVYYPVCHSTNGARVKATARSFSLDETAEVYANRMGWGANRGPGHSLHYWNGASYGGLGGVKDEPIRVDRTYGSRRKPSDPGSASQNVNGWAVSSGGGYVFIRTDKNMKIDGTIKADGGPNDTGGAASSGGGVWLYCGGKLSGTGSISAKGGNGSSNYVAGGGGRIAVWYANKADDCLIDTCIDGGTISGETTETLKWGTIGSVCWHQIPGLMLFVR